MNKCHTNIGWRNDTTPAINETNLNYMDGCIDTIDDRVVAMDTSKANQSDLLTALSNVTYNTSTGVFTFTWKNGTTATIDLNVEKIPVSFSMDENGVITMITEDGTTYTADVSAILKTYSFTNSSTIGWTVTQNGNNYTVTADIVDGSITANKLQPNYLADVTAQAQAASAAATAASGSAGDAADSAEDSEAWAVGQRGGVDVDPTDPTYHNNAKYWKDQAQAAAGGTFAGLSDVNVVSPTNGQVPAYNSTSGKWENADIDAEDISYDNTDSGLAATEVKGAIDEVAGALHEEEVTATGNPLSFTTDSEQVAQNVVITFESIQAGSGDPSPSNVRTISGYDSIDIAVPRKNWFDGTYLNAIFSATGTANVIRFASSSTGRVGILPIAGGQTYHIHKNSGDRLAVVVIDKEPVIGTNYSRLYVGQDTDTDATVTVPDGMRYMLVYVDSANSVEPQMQVELGETATAYEPYNPITDISIKLNETLYSGTLDLESGKLVVDKACVIYDGDENWNTYAGGFYIVAAGFSYAQINQSICNEFTFKASGATSGNYSQISTSGAASPLFLYSGVSDVSGWKTWLASNPLQFVYPLATPIAIQLPPAQVKLLQGANVVTTNGTSISLTYRNGEVAKLSDLSGFADSVNKAGKTFLTREENNVLGAKNLLPNNAVTLVNQGVTFTVNTDKSVTISGTPTGNPGLNFIRNLKLPEGKYILSGAVANAGLMYYIQGFGDVDYTSGAGIFTGTNDSVEFTLTSENTMRFNIEVRSNFNGQVTTFKPMIRLASDPDDTYVPYAKTNRELTQEQVKKTDLTSIIATGLTNTTGAQIPNGAYFYLNGVFCRAIADIATNATFTKNTNYVETSVGDEIGGLYFKGTDGQGQVITASGQSYTAPFNGFISGKMSSSSSSSNQASVRINGVTFARAYSSDVFVMFPCAKGSVITSTGTGAFDLYYSR